MVTGPSHAKTSSRSTIWIELLGRHCFAVPTGGGALSAALMSASALIKAVDAALADLLGKVPR